MQGFVSRLAATRKRQGNQEKQVEDVYAEEEEQERNGVRENVSFPNSVLDINLL